MTDPSSVPQLGEIQARSRRAQVLDVLRDAILDGDFQPGQALREAELAAQLGVSRAPIREAFQTLSAEGLIESVPYHGTTVRALTGTDIEELYSLRSALESFAIGRIISRHDPQDIEQLQQIYANMQRATGEGDLKRLSGEDQNFHSTLIRLSRHSLLISIWNVLAMRIRQVMALRNQQQRDISQIAAHHLPIISAIIAQDTDLATRLIQEHIASATALILDEWG